MFTARLFPIVLHCDVTVDCVIVSEVECGLLWLSMSRAFPIEFSDRIRAFTIHAMYYMYIANCDSK